MRRKWQEVNGEKKKHIERKEKTNLTKKLKKKKKRIRKSNGKAERVMVEIGHASINRLFSPLNIPTLFDP